MLLLTELQLEAHGVQFAVDFKDFLGAVQHRRDGFLRVPSNQKKKKKEEEEDNDDDDDDD